MRRFGLHSAANLRVEDCSQSDLRKLRVAMALLGQPRVALLDSPSLDMDRRSRRALLGLISSTMRGRCVIVASAVAEECELLCRRVAMLAGGRMRCIGSPQELRMKLAEGYLVEIQTGNTSAEPVAKFISNHFVSTTVLEQSNHSVKMQIPRFSFVPGGRVRASDQLRPLVRTSNTTTNADRMAESATAEHKSLLQQEPSANGSEDMNSVHSANHAHDQLRRDHRPNQSNLNRRNDRRKNATKNAATVPKAPITPPVGAPPSPSPSREPLLPSAAQSYSLADLFMLLEQQRQAGRITGFTIVELPFEEIFLPFTRMHYTDTGGPVNFSQSVPAEVNLPSLSGIVAGKASSSDENSLRKVAVTYDSLLASEKGSFDEKTAAPGALSSALWAQDAPAVVPVSSDSFPSSSSLDTLSPLSSPTSDDDPIWWFFAPSPLHLRSVRRSNRRQLLGIATS